MKPKTHISKKTTILKAIIIIMGVLFLYTSCTNKSQSSSNNKTTKTNNTIPSTTVVITNPPITVNLDTCPAPKIIKIPSPEIKPAGFFVQMQNYNTEQGLPLSGVFSGYTDKNGNLWFGTDGGGVVRYDGKFSTTYTTAQGLANNVISCIAEDKNGNMWFGTNGGGASCFNGNTFTNYTTKQGIPNDIIRSIKEDKNGNIWIGTRLGGLCRLNYNKKSTTGKINITNFTNIQQLKSSSVLSITEDSYGNLWFGTSKEGIFRLNQNQKNKASEQTLFTNYTTNQGLPSNRVLNIIEDDEKNMWFGTDAGVTKFSQNQKNELPDQLKFSTFTTTQGLANNTVLSICKGEKGELWMGTQGGGVSFYDSSKEKAGENPFINYTIAEGLANNDIRNIIKDKSGNMWFGTYGGGISVFSKNTKAFTNYTTAQGLVYNTVFSITQDKNENMWFSTYGGGISQLNTNAKIFTNFGISQGFPTIIQSVTEDSKENIWLSTERNGVYKINPDRKSFKNYTAKQGFLNTVIKTIIEDKDGNMWFGTENGAYQMDKEEKKITNYSTAQGLVGNTIWNIIEDRNGNIWFSTQEGGVSKLDKNKKTFTNYTKAQGLGDNFVVSLFEDKSGNIWFATAGGGLARFDGKSFLNYTTTQGLPDNVVTQVLEDKNNKIWIGTNKGICGLNYKTVASSTKKEKIIPGANSLTNQELKKYTPVFDTYNQQTGYAIKDVNGGQHSMFIDNKGIIWIGTGDDKVALVRFDPTELTKNKNKLNVVIHSIKINEEKICWNDLIQKSTIKNQQFDSIILPPNIVEEMSSFGKELTEIERKTMRKKFADVYFDSITRFYPVPKNLKLPYKHNNVTFDFAAIEPSKPDMVHYRYILEGYDKEWSPITEKTSATFGNIDEGNYTLKIKAQNPDGIWSQPITYIFEVLPPWYRTWWAYALESIFSFVLLFGIYHWRTASLRRDKELLEKTVQERTLEVVSQKTLVEEKNKELEKLSIVARETANGVFITNANGDLEWFNEGFSKLFGWISVAEYIKKRGKNIFEVSGNDNIGNLIKEAINQKKSITYENATPSKDRGNLWIQTTLTPIFNSNKELNKLVFIETDITELKNSEEQLSSANKELEAFSYSVSHDLRAPLRAINGYSKILYEDYAQNIDADGLNALNAILNNSKKMGELIDDLLAFSKLGRTEIINSEIDMTNLIQSIIHGELIENPNKIKFVLNEIINSEGTRILIQQVWVNLISNAVKFSKNNPKPIIEIGSYQKDNFVIYYVKDNGAGFNMQYYDKLFGVFQRLHSQEEFEGTGIGLAIVQKIIHRHNGLVWAESKLGEGACFYFSLPIINS